ncbi:MAG: hypothetical protein EOO96_00425 [Pedobacter sp.]|nr:MAG: hypothetical protein EOO96_00425 [Pedobacter sp.]
MLGRTYKITAILFSMMLLACNNKTTNTAEEPMLAPDTIAVEAIADKPAIKETEIAESPVVDVEDDEMALKDSINFAKFEVGTVATKTKAPIDFSSYPEAKAFKTRIIEGYQELEVNFAGHYVATYFGCGASCIMGFMVDANDGKIYDLPLGEGKMCFWNLDRAVYLSSSKLFISSICKRNETDKDVFYIASVWDEEAKEFKDIDEKEFLISKK